ncbi:hypothetical protein ACWFR5_43355 [Streptomyces sp. NPDC055092]
MTMAAHFSPIIVVMHGLTAGRNGMTDASATRKPAGRGKRGSAGWWQARPRWWQARPPGGACATPGKVPGGWLADVVGVDQQPGPVMSMMPIFMNGVVRWSPPG